MARNWELKTAAGKKKAGYRRGVSIQLLASSFQSTRPPRRLAMRCCCTARFCASCSALAPADLSTNKDRAIAKLWIYQRPRNERYEAGKQMRKVCPRSSHAKWEAPANRPDPVDLIKESNKGRIPNLVPLRHGRMVTSPFTFYRGAALNMASDLSGTPVTGMYLQACGDAHLCNFGGFATPERNIIFSINDLDETCFRTLGMGCKTTGCQFRRCLYEQ